jgi:tripartite-type tricarboxylate transporter receptor subunit TctC
MKILILIASLLLSFNVNANGPIEFVVTAAAGGSNDTVTRRLIEKLENNSSLKFVSLNKPGASHHIGYNYTFNNNKPMLIISTPEITKHEVYSTLDDVYTLGYFSNTLFVSEKSGIKNFKQFVDLSKTREINFGHGGVGTYSYQAMQIVCEKTLKCLEVAYKGGAQGILGIMSGEIDTYAITTYGSKHLFENNKLVPIYNIDFLKDKSWVKLFAKNISQKNKEIILNILQSQDPKFYTDMGFEK